MVSNDGNFYPRSPCGERLKILPQHLGTLTISIHALLAESDDASITAASILAYFYPRSPCGERPGRGKHYRSGHCISIHALLAESDETAEALMNRMLSFLSTLSLRRATSWDGASLSTKLFLSTLSLRRATFMASPMRMMVGFLSTLSLRRATFQSFFHSSRTN